MEKQCAVSIIIPVFNQEKYISETLDCLISQKYQNWECIIVNDGSTDHTESICMGYAQIDQRFKYYYKKNSGVSNSRNYGASKSIGEYLLFLDSDDIITIDYLENAVSRFMSDSTLNLVYCEAVFFDGYSGRIELKPFEYKTLLLENVFFNAVIIKKKEFDLTYGFSDKMKKGWEDWEFFIRFLNDNSVVYKIPKVCFFYRILPNSRDRSICEIDKNDLFLQIYENNKEIYDKYFPNPIYFAYLYVAEKNKNKILQDAIKSISNSKKYKIGQFLYKILNLFK